MLDFYMILLFEYVLLRVSLYASRDKYMEMLCYQWLESLETVYM